MNDTEDLMKRIRDALGDLNDDNVPVTTLVRELAQRICEAEQQEPVAFIGEHDLVELQDCTKYQCVLANQRMSYFTEPLFAAPKPAPVSVPDVDVVDYFVAVSEAIAHSDGIRAQELIGEVLRALAANKENT